MNIYDLHPQAPCSLSWIQWVLTIRVTVTKRWFWFHTYKHCLLPLGENGAEKISLLQLQKLLLPTQFLGKKNFERSHSWVLNVCIYVCMCPLTDFLFSFPLFSFSYIFLIFLIFFFLSCFQYNIGHVTSDVFSLKSRWHILRRP